VDIAGDAPGNPEVHADRLWEEAVYLAYYLHWPLEQILDLEHPVRAR